MLEANIALELVHQVQVVKVVVVQDHVPAVLPVEQEAEPIVLAVTHVQLAILVLLEQEVVEYVVLVFTAHLNLVGVLLAPPANILHLAQVAVIFALLVNIAWR